ncbi:hypothetical protein NMG60_11006537 [Bertholletia excelsa]
MTSSGNVDLGEYRKKEREDNLQVQAVWFAAGTAVAAAFLQRAAVVSLAEQWRLWVFVALNLLLLAILFTSTCKGASVSTSSEGCGESNGAVAEGDADEKKKRKECSGTVSTDEGEGEAEGECDRLKLHECGSGREIEMEAVEDEDATKPAMGMSKEELNERVEAFIAMFRQQLVSDAKDRDRRLRYSARARPCNA